MVAARSSVVRCSAFKFRARKRFFRSARRALVQKAFLSPPPPPTTNELRKTSRIRNTPSPPLRGRLSESSTNSEAFGFTLIETDRVNYKPDARTIKTRGEQAVFRDWKRYVLIAFFFIEHRPTVRRYGSIEPVRIGYRYFRVLPSFLICSHSHIDNRTFELYTINVRTCRVELSISFPRRSLITYRADFNVSDVRAFFAKFLIFRLRGCTYLSSLRYM